MVENKQEKTTISTKSKEESIILLVLLLVTLIHESTTPAYIHIFIINTYKIFLISQYNMM